MLLTVTLERLLLAVTQRGLLLAVTLERLLLAVTLQRLSLAGTKLWPACHQGTGSQSPPGSCLIQIFWQFFFIGIFQL